MKKIVTLLIILLQGYFVFCQNMKGVIATSTSDRNQKVHNTYALIIGISVYDDPNMPQLEYADSDAVCFYRFLRSKTGGSVDSLNIRLLTDHDATSSDIWRELNWIMRRADTSDRVYIYFSGHGDAGNNQEEVYLLTHETAKVDDPGLYVPTSALPVMNLKTKIKTLSNKNVEVILITDACRTNELSGKNAGNELIYRNVMDENLGAIQIASCKANQMAQEGKKWGSGRGVFSFHLINGLYGLADNEPADGKVDLEELEAYVKENVKHDTRSLSTGVPMQVPSFNGKNTTLCKVDANEKQSLESSLNQGSEIVVNVRTGNLPSERTTDSLLHRKFLKAIADERLLAPEKNNAVYWLNLLLTKTNDDNAKADFTDVLISALLKKGQQSINYYSKGLLDSIQFNYKYFLERSSYFKTALTYVKNNPEIYRLANASRLFLEARALCESRKEEDWKRAIAIADSSLGIYRWAYTYHTKGLLFENLRMFDSLVNLERKVIEIAPTWSSAYNSLGRGYYALRKFDSAGVNYLKAIRFNPRDYASYLGIGNLYFDRGEKDSAAYYFKISIQLNPKSDFGYYNLGIINSSNGQFDSAIFYYNKAIQVNPKSEDSYIGIANVYYELKKYDSSAFYYKKSIEHNPLVKDSYYNTACSYSLLKDKRNALKYFALALQKGWNDFEWAATDHDLDNIRNEKEYIDLIKKYTSPTSAK